MSAQFVPPSDAEIDNLREQLGYYELVRFLAWRSYKQAQDDIRMQIEQARSDVPPSLPAHALPLLRHPHYADKW